MTVDLNAEVIRAGEARQVLDSPVFQSAKERIDSQLADLRRTVPLRDTDMHTRLILMEQLWANLLNFFEQLAQTGKMAEMQLREAEEKRSLLERGIAMFRTNGRI